MSKRKQRRAQPPALASKEAQAIERRALAARPKLANVIDDLVAKFERSGISVDQLFRSLVRSTEPHFVATQQALYDTTLASYLAGGDSVSASFVPPTSRTAGAPRLPLVSQSEPSVRQIFYDAGETPTIRFPIIDRAGQRLRDATIYTSDEYRQLAAGAREHAFSITADIEQRTVEKLRDILADNVSTSVDRRKFVRDVREQLPELPVNDARLDMVFRNNVNSSYSDGAEQTLSQPIVGNSFPYRAYVAIRDDRVRPEHLMMEKLGLDGTNVYHKDDPVWLLFRPPWDFNCRCGWIPYTIRQAARAGVREAQQWLDTGQEPVHTFVARPPFAPPTTFSRELAA